MPPLISCLMVTLPVPDRAAGLHRAIADYRCQNYPRRELVLVLNGGEAPCQAAIAAHVAALADASIRLVAPPGLLPLGALRNAAVAAAQGEVLCQWDDDDRYHPDRLAQQQALLATSGAAAVLLAEVMQYFVAERSLFHTNWRATEAGGFPGSILWRRTAGLHYPEAGAEARLGEDSAVLRQLAEAGPPALLAEAPWLYVYTTHGGNSWPAAHHRMLSRELAVSRGMLARREARLRAGLAPFCFGPGAVAVQGYNGVAFELAGETETVSS